jgi:hypothetical protein
MSRRRVYSCGRLNACIVRGYEARIDVTPATIFVAMRGNLLRENAQTPKFARRRLMRSSHMTVVIPNLDEIIR